MIRVTVELVSAITGKTTKLGSATIANDGTGDHYTGNYYASFDLKRKKGWRTSTVRGFKRQKHNVWYLLTWALAEALRGDIGQ